MAWADSCGLFTISAKFASVELGQPQDWSNPGAWGQINQKQTSTNNNKWVLRAWFLEMNGDQCYIMMTSRHGNAYHITGRLWWDHPWYPLKTRAVLMFSFMFTWTNIRVAADTVETLYNTTYQYWALWNICYNKSCYKGSPLYQVCWR